MTDRRCGCRPASAVPPPTIVVATTAAAADAERMRNDLRVSAKGPLLAGLAIGGW
jgi:hypothetical protein